MNQKDFERYLARDKACIHCGEREAVAPHHRANRGMGGSKELDRPSNIIVICSRFNGLMESDPRSAAIAQQYGWKLSKWDDPTEVPVWDTLKRQWFQLADDFSRNVVELEG